MTHRQPCASPKSKTNLSKRLDYDNILSLFSNKHTSNLFQRQVAVLYRVCRHNPSGFNIADLPHIEQLVNFSIKRIRSGHAEFAEPLCDIVSLCGQPFFLQKANEDIRSEGDIRSLLLCIGQLLLEKSTSVQLAAAETLTAYTQALGHPGNDDKYALLIDKSNNPDDLRLPARVFNDLQMNKSGAVGQVIAALRLEVEEMFNYDADKDGKISKKEMHRFKVMNDSNNNNDDEHFDGKTEDVDEDAQGEEEKPPPYFLISLVKLIRELSYSAINARAITRSNVTDQLVRVLSSIENFREEVVHVVVEILWNLLDQTAAELERPSTAMNRKELLDKFRFSNAMYVLGKPATVEVLRRLLRKIIIGGYRQTDKELRNEVLINLSLLASRKINRPLFCAGGDNSTIALLLEYGCAIEMEETTEADVRNFGTAEPLDFEFKQLIWSLLLTLSTETGCLAAIQASHLTKTLLSHLHDTGPQKPAHLTYALGQQRALRLQVLAALFVLVPRCPAAFRASDGLRVLLDFARQRAKPPPPPPPSKGSAVAPSIDKDLLHAVLQLLSISSELEGAATSLSELDAIPFALSVFQGTAGTIAREWAIVLCSKLCAEHPDNQTSFRRAGGVKALVECIHSREFQQSTQEEVLMAAVIDAVWSAIVGNRQSEARMVKCNGVDALLDFLDACPRLMQNQLIGCLADLTQNRKALHDMKIWRSDRSMRSLRQVLVACWLDEEKRLQIEHMPHGSIRNMSRPLSGGASSIDMSAESPSRASERLRNALRASNMYMQAQKRHPEAAMRRSVRKLDLRTKLFALLRGIGFDDEDDRRDTTTALRRSAAGRAGSEDSGEEKTAAGGAAAAVEGMDSGLGQRERICLALAKECQTFQVVATWRDIKEELKRQKVNPILADMLYMERQLDDAFNCACRTKFKQQVLYEEQLQMEQANETKFLSTLRARNEQEMNQTKQGRLGRSFRKTTKTGPRTLRPGKMRETASSTSLERDNK